MSDEIDIEVTGPISAAAYCFHAKKAAEAEANKDRVTSKSEATWMEVEVLEII